MSLAFRHCWKLIGVIFFIGLIFFATLVFTLVFNWIVIEPDEIKCKACFKQTFCTATVYNKI